MNRFAERTINFLASLITIGLFVLSIIPATSGLSALSITPRLGVETRIAGLLLVELAILYSSRIMLRRVLKSAPVVQDEVAAFLAYIGALVLIGWASAIDLNFFFPADTSADSFGRVLYIGVCVVFGSGTNSDMLPKSDQTQGPSASA